MGLSKSAEPSSWEKDRMSTKSHKIRRVDMSRQLHAALMRLKEVRQLDAMSEGKVMQPWVFLSPEGVRWDDRNLRRGWYRCLEAAGIREVRFHDLRHTFVSLLIRQGAHPKYIQEQAGHSSIQVTMDTYGHFVPSQNQERVSKWDELKVETKTAPSEHPRAEEAEQVSLKPLENMVAVTRIERVTRGL